MYPNCLVGLLIIKKIVHKIISYTVSKNQYVGNLRQNCWLFNSNRINGNKIVLSISAQRAGRCQ